VKDRLDRSAFLKTAGVLSVSLPVIAPTLAYGRVITPPGSDLGFGKTIWQELKGIPELSILLGLIDETGLKQILNQIPLLYGYTLFAPNDDAFKAFGGGIKEIKHLLRTLENIVVPELVLLSGLLGGLLGTLGGIPLGITRTKGNILVDEVAKIIKGDIRASNGVIHIIDAVPKQIIV